MSRQGYTLVELSIVLSLSLIVAAFSVHLVFRSAKREVLDALICLQSELACLRQQSICCKEKITVNFLLIENKYQIIQREKVLTVPLPKNVNFGFKVGVNGPPGKPESPILEAVKFENPRPRAAIIHPNGRISSGTIYLKHRSHDFMGALTMSPNQIAYIRVYEFQGERWKKVY